MLFHRSKGVTIVGCSPFDTALASTLYHRGYRVVVFDKGEESFRYPPEGFGGSKLEGDPTDPRMLKRAGIGRTGMIIAATQDDNFNLLISQIASNIFQMRRVYTRLGDISRCRLITDVPIQPISLYNLPADDYKDLADSVSREVAVRGLQ